MAVKNIDELYRSYVVDVKRYLLSLTSNKDLTDDLLQETFLRAYLHIESCPLDYVKPWLFKIAYHLYMDYLRKHKPIIVEETFFEALRGTELVEGIILSKEQAMEMRKAIERLPEKQKQAIFLIYFSEFSYMEAAKMMDISLSHLKVTIFRGKQLLKKEIERMIRHE
ncbi:MAG: RNA polymerase sigma factor [Bacillaceae bacterium]